MIGHYKVSCLCLAYGTKPVRMDFLCSWSIMALDLEFFYWPLDRDVFCNLWFILVISRCSSKTSFQHNLVTTNPAKNSLTRLTYLWFIYYLFPYGLYSVRCLTEQQFWVLNEMQSLVIRLLWRLRVAWFVGKNL